MESEPLILVVDDDIEWKEILFDILESARYSMMYAGNIREAKHLLNQHKFLVVTVDLQFKKGQHYEYEEGPNLLEHIQNTHPEIHCIVITGSEKSITDSTDLVLKYKHIVRKYLAKDDRQLPNKLVEEIESIFAETQTVAGLNQLDNQRSFEKVVTPANIPDVTTKAKPQSPATVFISYSHKDEHEKNRLVTHLSILQKTDLVNVWVDDRIEGGADWENEIKQAIVQSRVAILLISANFLTSDFILGEEIPAFLKRRKKEGLTVFPIIAKACAWEQFDWLARMNVRPKNGRSIWSGSESQIDEDLSKIIKEVAGIVKK